MSQNYFNRRLQTFKSSLPSSLYLFLYRQQHPLLSRNSTIEGLRLNPFSLSTSDIDLKPESRVLMACPGATLNALVSDPTIADSYDYVITNSRAFYLNCLRPDLIVYEISDISGDFGLQCLRDKMLLYPKCKALILLGPVAHMVNADIIDELNVLFDDPKLADRTYFAYCYISPAPQKRIASAFLRNTSADSFPFGIVPHIRSSSSVPILISFFRKVSSISFLGLDGAGDYVFSRLRTNDLEAFCYHPHMDGLGLLKTDLSPELYERSWAHRPTAVKAHQTNDPYYGAFTMHDFLALMSEFVQLSLVSTGTAFDSLLPIVNK